MNLPFNPTISSNPLPKHKNKNINLKDIFTIMFIAILNTIAKIWKQNNGILCNHK